MVSSTLSRTFPFLFSSLSETQTCITWDDIGERQLLCKLVRDIRLDDNIGFGVVSVDPAGNIKEIFGDLGCGAESQWVIESVLSTSMKLT